MDFLGIEAFLAIVQTRSLTKAAELLHLSQSTVSYRLKILERDMGQTLIERNKGIQTIRLTTFGENFVPLAERWNTLKREVDILQAGCHQFNLTIAAVDSLHIYVLPPLYRALIQQCPSVRFHLRTQHSLESYESIERREIDVAFVKMERVVPNITVEPFYVDEMVLVRLAAEDRLATSTISPSELDGRHQLYCNWGPSYQMWHDRWWDNPSRLEIDAAALIFSLMWDSRQWAIVPRSFANTISNNANFVVQRLSDPPPPRACYKVMAKHADPVKAPALDMINNFVKMIYSSNESKTYPD